MVRKPPPHPAQGAAESPATRPSLIARLQQPGDESRWQEDWREFHDLYRPLLAAQARREGLSEMHTEDVIQEILSGIAKNLPGFIYDPSKCRLRTWLFQVAKNKINDHRRRQQRQLPPAPVAVDSPSDQEHQPEIPDLNSLQPDEAWDANFERQLLDVATQRAGRRSSVMNFRLYLYHVVQHHDVDSTVAAFRESNITPAMVHLAKSRVLKLVREELETLRGKFSD